MGKQSFGEREYIFRQRPGPRGVIESILVREYTQTTVVVALGWLIWGGGVWRGEGRWEPRPRG